MGNRNGNAGDAPPPQRLAHRVDFQLGAATIRPSVRTVEGPLGRAVAEPRVMQVLLAFSESNGAVLTRDDLIRDCWNGAIVGDDAVNRTVAEIRRIARATGANFELETIPRVGYRLISQESPAPATAPASARPASRRWIVGGAVAVGLAGAAGWWWRSHRTNPRYEALMEQGRQALRMMMPGAEEEASTAFQQAADLEPSAAAAWGLLSLSLRLAAEGYPQAEAAKANLAAVQASGRALKLDAREPNALYTQALMRGTLIDWMAMEKAVRHVLTIEPSHPHALDYLIAMLQAAGYVQESWEHNERAIAFDALRPTPQYRKALKLWIVGRPDMADEQAALCMSNWPLINNVRNARLVVAAFTGRLQAASLLLDDPGTARLMLSANGIGMWKLGLAALDTRARQDVQRAREACLAAAPLGAGLGAHAVMLLSALDEVDAAYQIVDGLMLRRGQMVTRGNALATGYEAHVSWRSTQWLFTPATRSLRADRRFASLCDAIGITDYWKQRGALPDERRS
jgi:DNA-binding winged helix-turn-helix (wHTH) protein